MINSCLLITFDILRKREPETPYSASCLTSYIKSREDYGKKFTISAYSINMNNWEISGESELVKILECSFQYSILAMSVYCWSQEQVRIAINILKKQGWSGKIVLGGPDITSMPEKQLLENYPEVSHFVKGSGEIALEKILIGDANEKILDCPIEPHQLPSPYLTNEINLSNYPSMVRWETKRGCPFQCDYCEWRGRNIKVPEFHLSRLQTELDLFQHYKVDKVNVLDGTFNTSKYMHCLELFNHYSTILFSLQVNPNLIRKLEGKRFLEMCSNSGNVFLELGIQSIVFQEMKVLKRMNNVYTIWKAIRRLKKLRIPFEINLIYGIPGQTKKSFLRNIHFCLLCGCAPAQIRCFPLRIPNGSNLELNKSSLCVGEEAERDNFDIKIVSTSISFTKEDWIEMDQISHSLVELFPRRHKRYLKNLKRSFFSFRIIIGDNEIIKMKRVNLATPKAQTKEMPDIMFYDYIEFIPANEISEYLLNESIIRNSLLVINNLFYEILHAHFNEGTLHCELYTNIALHQKEFTIVGKQIKKERFITNTQ